MVLQIRSSDYLTYYLGLGRGLLSLSIAGIRWRDQTPISHHTVSPLRITHYFTTVFSQLSSRPIYYRLFFIFRFDPSDYLTSILSKWRAEPSLSLTSEFSVSKSLARTLCIRFGNFNFQKTTNHCNLPT